MATLSVTVTIQTPQVPNFVRTTEGKYIPVKDLTSDCIDELAEEWKEKLRDNMNRQQRNPDSLAEKPRDEIEFANKDIANFLNFLSQRIKPSKVPTNTKEIVHQAFELLTGKTGMAASTCVRKYIETHAEKAT